jgi:thiamine-phosphate pyrophosphorylase
VTLPSPIGVYAILDAGACDPAALPSAAGSIAGAGVHVFQVRAKSMPAGALVRLVREVRAALPGDRVLIVNDRADVALAAGADGVHVGDEDLPPEAARAVLPRGGVVGFSTHSTDEARSARASACDYIGFGPLFASPTKPTPRPVHGIEGLAAACAAATAPVVAIGGIAIADLPAIRAAGASGAALISALLPADRAGGLAAAAIAAWERGSR